MPRIPRLMPMPKRFQHLDPRTSDMSKDGPEFIKFLKNKRSQGKKKALA
jgi:hypothetical protein